MESKLAEGTLNPMWKSVIGWEGFYEVSSLGEVRSVDRRVMHTREYERTLKGQYLKTPLDKGGYQMVNLSRPCHIQKSKVHHLVLEAFVGPRPDGMECRHLNNNPSDNRVENLCWGTKEENLYDKVANGLTKGENHHGAKLTAFQVFMLREIPARRGLLNDIAANFGIQKMQVSRIRSGANWGWL